MDLFDNNPNQNPAGTKPAEARILIAGIGNIFFGDDAFGVAVAQRLALRPVPPGLQIVDFGIRGWDLVFSLLEPWDAIILVDATRRGGAPGTLYLLEVDTSSTKDDPGAFAIETHNIDPHKVLALAQGLGAPRQRVWLVGCEPGPDPEASLGMQISPAVEASLAEAEVMIENLAHRLLNENQPEPQGDNHGNHS